MNRLRFINLLVHFMARFHLKFYSSAASIINCIGLMAPNGHETGDVPAYNIAELLFSHAQLDGTVILPTP
jgi:hypothetical protein